MERRLAQTWRRREREEEDGVEVGGDGVDRVEEEEQLRTREIGELLTQEDEMVVEKEKDGTAMEREGDGMVVEGVDDDVVGEGRSTLQRRAKRRGGGRGGGRLGPVAEAMMIREVREDIGLKNL
ncbi:hypothetical protein NHX12_033877 [Muraenolepis orangiensis]|uniref:Uncharacterized protein n=1 Tax=Muraenolepis orangiensis TaxID=630683 RepID=A0A9Q0IJ27_9TELE|nr:hypothetical protein NHX12_033877 [Muraenolepis orangiensis]